MNKQPFMKNFVIILLLFLSFNVDAQLLDGNSGVFTKADTLRGMLRPERTCFDVKHYDLVLDINFENKSISGYNDIFFMAVEDFNTLQIDLFENMEITDIVFANTSLKYRREFNAVFIDFPKTIHVGSLNKMTVFYKGKPIIAKNAPWDGGFSWKKDKNGKDWLGVSCEGIGASLWWPNKDHLSDEPETMTVTCTFPKDLKFVGNGTLVSNTEKDDRRTMKWATSYPINNYNVTLNIGDYVNFQDEYVSTTDSQKLVLDYWVMPYNLEKAKKQFEQVKPMLAAHEKYFGKFPFWNDNYKLVETPYLGMEHQTAIAYGNDYKTGYNGYDFSRIGLKFDYIIIHESGHEYWGNLVSTADMADLWIHEGFCTYSEALYVEYMFGFAKALEYINAKKPTIENDAPILGAKDVNVEGSGDMYNKGMLLLNTVRHIINNDVLWFSILKEMTTKEFAYKTTNTEEVVNFISKKSDQDLTQVFKQYLVYKSIPKLYYSIENVSGSEYKINYKWLTDVDNFNMPIVLKVGKKEYRLKGSNELQNFKFKKGKNDKISFDEDKFYFDVMESKF